MKKNRRVARTLEKHGTVKMAKIISKGEMARGGNGGSGAWASENEGGAGYLSG